MKAFAIFILFGSLISVATAHAEKVIYEVPTEQENLRPYARFELQDFQKVQNGNELEISYTLPLELTGEAVHIVFRGEVRDDGEIRLRGEHGVAKCHENLCEADYFRSLPINPEAVVERVKDVSHSEEEFDTRIQLSHQFGGNPIGLVQL